MDRVIVVLGTARDNSNTLNALNGHLPWKSYDLIELHKLKLEAYAYSANKAKDDFLRIADEMVKADLIVFATPVYWYSMSGVMKIFFDRFTDLVTTSKDIGRSLKGKRTFLFATGSEETLPEGFEVPFQRTSEYFGMKYSGSMYVSVKDP